MTFRVRPATGEDFAAIYEMAKLTGGGFTNLPPDRATLVAKLARSEDSFSRTEDSQSDDLYVFVLEDPKAKIIRGTCQVFGQVGVRQAFYSYHLSTLTQTSPELGKTFRNQMLTLTTDLEGSSEVGGLFLHPADRAGGVGVLLARSRYLFIRRHRALFADRTIAELRGLIDEAGSSPFWDGIGAKFFGMAFRDADEFNAMHGHQFIADLMPKHPIYTAMLPDAARLAIGVPHFSGRAAMRMLEDEGFQHDRYVDIFDGGPTVSVATDAIRSVRDAVTATVTRTDIAPGETRTIVSRGSLLDFVASFGTAEPDAAGVGIDPVATEAIGARIGDDILYILGRS